MDSSSYASLYQIDQTFPEKVLHQVEVEVLLWEDKHCVRMVLSVLELPLESQTLVEAMEGKLHNRDCSHAGVVVQP
eukprot:11445639-Prorocentrum_lima.AAC.1